MAEREDNPASLANLWLKSKPSRPGSSRAQAPEDEGEVQMGLVFSVPPPEPPTAYRPSKPRAKPIATANSVPLGIEIQTQPAPPRPGAAPHLAPQQRRIWTVRALVTDLRQQVETSYADLWVEGEISNCRPAPSGHIYFTLKDGEAQLPVVLFRRQAQLLRFRPQDGLAILARGRISVYESRGQLQLVADSLELRGAGQLQLVYEQLKARLLAEGLFDAARKRPLPAFPRSIGVITSTGGAVLHDIVKVIRRRHARLSLLIYPALMQGPECPATVAAGIRFFNRLPTSELSSRPKSQRSRDVVEKPAIVLPHVDLILIARGGGPFEDIAGFNDETLARAIAASTLPVVSAIGHETDFTIADFVADLRAPTPSAAAELITAAQHRIEERVQTLESRIHRAIRYQFVLARQRFTSLSASQVLTRVRDGIGRRGQRLDDLRHCLESAMARRLRTPTLGTAALTNRLERHNPTFRLALARRRLESASQSLNRLSLTGIAARTSRLAHASARLEALSPLAVLSRGYALVYTVDGQLLRNAAETKPGRTVHTRLAKGSITAKVDRVDTE